MIKGYHLQLRYHPLLFYNVKQFNIKAAVAHESVILQKVYELLLKGATDPSTGGAGYYCNVFVVPMHTCGYVQ